MPVSNDDLNVMDDPNREYYMMKARESANRFAINQKKLFNHNGSVKDIPQDSKVHDMEDFFDEE